MRARLVLCGLLVAALPAAAQPGQPAARTPWSVEAPGSLGARFGVGLDLLVDRIGDAEVVGGSQSVTTGADGSPRTTVVPLDVGLANRKHRQEWEERSLGLQVPVALPPLRLPGALRVEPSLVFEASAVEGELTFVDRVEGAADRSLDGTAARWGAGVEAVGELCRGCRWLWSAGYRYRSLGGVDLDGDTGPDPGGPTVTESTEVDHDAHHLTARLGALIAGGRAIAYVGVRDRRSDLVVRDATHVTSSQGGPSATVDTRLVLDADDTAALAGLDFRFRRRYVGRVEATFGGDSESLLLKVVRLIPRRSTEPTERPIGDDRTDEHAEPAVDDVPEPSDEREPGDQLPPPGRESPSEPGSQATVTEGPGPSDPSEQTSPGEGADTLQDAADVDARQRSAEEISDRVATAVRPLLDWMIEEAARLEREAGGGLMHPLAVLGFIDAVEPRLMEILSAKELGPLRAWFVEYFHAARSELSALIRDEKARRPRGTGERGELSFARLQPPAASDRRSAERPRAILDDLLAQVRRLFERADSRRLTTDLCVRSVPKRGALVQLSPAIPGSRVLVEQATENTFRVAFRGLYAYRAHLGGETIACPPRGTTPCAPLDLWINDGPFVVCDFRPDVRRCLLQAGDLDTCGR